MSVLPSVRASLAERFLFNFRMTPESLSRDLPVPWLIPQLIEGYAVVSFCVLDLRNITVSPLPTIAGLTSISCAPRYAVLDASKGENSPAVFVTERQTNSAFGAWFTTLGFSAPHPYVDASITHGAGETDISVSSPGEGCVMDAAVSVASQIDSCLFSTCEEFADFIRSGVTSYGLSRHSDRLTVMDLEKDDGAYEPLSVGRLRGPLMDRWLSDGAVLDSAFRTSGGRYEWTYHGLTEGH